MRIIGLTGGIATGKSTVVETFSKSFIAVIDADVIARQVVQPGKPAYKAILRHFDAQDVLVAGSNEIDRAKLGALVFSDDEKRKLLNRCTHPYIRRQMACELIWHYVTGMRAVVMDVPLLFESGLDLLASVTIVVWCPEDIQLARLMSRDKLSKEDALKRLRAQMPMEKKKALADVLINNSGSPKATTLQVEKFIAQYEPGWPWTFLLWFFPPVAIIVSLCVLARNWLRIRNRKKTD